MSHYRHLVSVRYLHKPRRVAVLCIAVGRNCVLVVAELCPGHGLKFSRTAYLDLWSWWRWVGVCVVACSSPFEHWYSFVALESHVSDLVDPTTTRNATRASTYLDFTGLLTPQHKYLPILLKSMRTNLDVANPTWQIADLERMPQSLFPP